MTDSTTPNPQDAAALQALIQKAIADGIAAGLAATQRAVAQPQVRERITLARLFPIIEESFTTSTCRTYMPYIRVLVHGLPGQGQTFAGYGDMYADEIRPSHLRAAMKHVKARAVATVDERNTVRHDLGRAMRTTSGTSSEYNAVGAWRYLFARAIEEGYVPNGENPALSLPKPKRKDGKRPALSQDEYDQFWDFIDSSGDDPVLDRMLCEAIVIAGARQEGLVDLTLHRLDMEECAILLVEKNRKAVWQPVPDWFIHRLYDFAVSRGATLPTDKVFIKRATGPNRPAAPITGRRFDNLFTDRLQAAFAWADKRKVAAHTLRHHATTVVERHAGRAVATAFARHEPEGVNGIYTLASRREVAQAVVELYGGDHPWLHREPKLPE